jgi:hypothetical protein
MVGSMCDKSITRPLTNAQAKASGAVRCLTMSSFTRTEFEKSGAIPHLVRINIYMCACVCVCVCVCVCIQYTHTTRTETTCSIAQFQM